MMSRQVSSVRNGSETLAKGTDELNEHTQQTVDNVQQTVATMNQNGGVGETELCHGVGCR